MKPIVSAIAAGSTSLLLEFMVVFYRASDIGHSLTEFSRMLMVAIIFIIYLPVSAIIAACEHADIHLYRYMTSSGAIVVGLISPVFWGSTAYLIHRHYNRKKSVEQSDAGYPPQGVGSPDP